MQASGAGTAAEKNGAPSAVRTGLVLEGGAMRGMFTAGVTDVMMENHIVFDLAVGVSAGVLFGCNYKSGQHGRTIRYNLTYCRDPRYGTFRSLFRSGDMYETEFCYETVPFRKDPFDSKAFRENPMEFWAVCTDVETGKPLYKKLERGDRRDVRWMVASAAMPLVSRIVRIGGHELLDGGVSDSIPLKFAESRGCQKNVVVLTQPEGYVKERNPLMPLMRLQLRKYPEFLRTAEQRHENYNAETAYVAEREQEGAAFVIRPEKALGISRVEKDPDALLRVYMMGRRVMEERMPELRRFLKG